MLVCILREFVDLGEWGSGEDLGGPGERNCNQNTVYEKESLFNKKREKVYR